MKVFVYGFFLQAKEWRYFWLKLKFDLIKSPNRTLRMLAAVLRPPQHFHPLSGIHSLCSAESTIHVLLLH
jgi:hypothetical protein